MPVTNGDSEVVHINAATFQKQLGRLGEVLAQKVKREAPALLSAPEYVAADLHVLMRQALRTYDLLFYLNADERRKTDCYWKPEYSFVILPLIRNMIDCLYNITVILQNPRRNGTWFRASGYRQWLKALDEDQARYGGRPEWDEWITKARDGVDFLIRANALKMTDVLNSSQWPTLGRYISDRQPGGAFTPHQEFLQTFTYGMWREYSAMAHGAFEGLMQAAVYYIFDSIPHEDRPKLDEKHFGIMSMHIARAAGVLLCIITELQAHFHFEGARINERIHEMWHVLMPVLEIKELYSDRYAQLMAEKRINP